MKVKKSYRDGSVDLESGLAFTPDGVQSFNHPYLAFAAEKTGEGICRAGRAIINMFARFGGYDQMTNEEYAGELPAPGTLRKCGGVCLGATGAFVAIVAGAELADIMPHAASFIAGSIQEKFVDPMIYGQV